MVDGDDRGERQQRDIDQLLAQQDAERGEAAPDASPSAAAPWAAAPGWYSHPDMVDTLCYWDGDEWTDRTAPAGPATAASPPPPTVAVVESELQERHQESAPLIGVLMLMAAVVLWPIGLIGGIFLVRQHRGWGIAVLATASLVAVISIALVASELADNVDDVDSSAGPIVIDPDLLEPQIEDYVEESMAAQSGTTTVDCPNGIEVLPGRDFLCDVTFDDGSVGQVEVDIEDEDGNVTWRLVFN